MAGTTRLPSLRALLAAAVLFMPGCSMLTSVMGYGDRQEMRQIQTKLTCGMTIAQIEALGRRRVVAWEVPDVRATHSIGDDADFAAVWLVMKDGKLTASELLVVDGLKTMHSETRVDHCTQVKRERAFAGHS